MMIKRMRLKARIVVILGATQASNADVLYVNNDTAYPAEYRSFDDAFEAAEAGDTIMLAASTMSYGDLTIVEKPVKVVGNKMESSEAPDQPGRADEKTTIVDRIYLGQPNSPSSNAVPSRRDTDGTVIEGLSADRFQIWSDGCSLKRCSASQAWIYGSSNLMEGCRFTEVDLDRRELNGDPEALSSGNNFRNCRIASSNGRLLRVDELASAEFHYCVIGVLPDGSLNPNYSPLSGALQRIPGNASLSFHNCIIADSVGGEVANEFNGPSSRLHHCLILGASDLNAIPSLSAGLNNLVEADFASVFSDEFFTLSENSPARGAGENGSDIGIFGGSTPYRWGGSPALPLINKLQILESNPTTGLKFKVEVSAQE